MSIGRDKTKAELVRENVHLRLELQRLNSKKWKWEQKHPKHKSLIARLKCACRAFAEN